MSDAVRLQHLSSVVVNMERSSLDGRLLGDEVHAALALLLLKLQGDTANRDTSVNAAHQVGNETGDLVTHALGGNDGNLISDTLVAVEVEGESGVETLDNSAGRALHSLSTNTTLKRKQTNWWMHRQ